MSDAERFAAKYEPEPMSGCWLWTSATTRGYGMFKHGRRMVYAHRFSYEQSRGPIPPPLQIDHKCRTPACVNPDHMEPVTQRENVLRGTSPFARKVRQTHCLRGHPLVEGNLYTSKGGRQCRRCTLDAVKASRERRRATA